MDLIRQLNETTTTRNTEAALFEHNCRNVASAAKVELIELAESVINWLDDIATQAEQGTLTKPKSDNTAAMADHVDKIRGTAEVIGGIAALTDPDMPDAMNVKNPKMVLKVAGSNHAQSDKALQLLKNLGRGEAAGFTKKAFEVLRSGDDQAITNTLRGLQNKAKKMLLIDQPTTSKEPEQATQQPGRLGLAGAMQEKPQI